MRSLQLDRTLLPQGLALFLQSLTRLHFWTNSFQSLFVIYVQDTCTVKPKIHQFNGFLCSHLSEVFATEVDHKFVGVLYLYFEQGSSVDSFLIQGAITLFWYRRWLLISFMRAIVDSISEIFWLSWGYSVNIYDLRSQSYSANLYFRAGSQMEEESNTEFKQRSLFSRKTIENWDDFKATWKQVFFNESLNYLDQQALTTFWEQQLALLSKQTEKITILVPLMVNKAQQPLPEQQDIHPPIQRGEQVPVGDNEKEKGQKKVPKQQKQPVKNNKKAGKKEANSQVKLDKKVIETAMNLIGQKFTKLEYVYESLFMGNEKQLLIYQSCGAMNRYLSKYRLPNHFKPKLDDFNKLADQFYEAKRKTNLVISTFSAKSRDNLLKQLNSLRQLMSRQLEDFRDYFKPILLDFAANSKTTIILLQTVRDEMLDMLQGLCKECQLEIKSKYFQTDYDEIKDLEITKPVHEDLENPCQNQEKEVPAMRYIYVEPPKLPQPPKDLYNVKLIGADLKHQSWIWRFFMPKCGQHNKVKGVYLRAPEGEGPSELNIQLNSPSESIDVELYPYKAGKIIWEIYLWNDVGFTKSTEKIIFYNELQIKGKSTPLTNYQVSLVGISDCGINLQQEAFQTVRYCKEVSIYNAAVICDAQGIVGGWGQMYYPLSQESEENSSSEIEISLNLFKNQRIESPFLVLKNEFIRKVSCGMGYTLMLSSLGVIWSFGFNGYGQLGQGHFDSNQYTTEPKQICKFTGEDGTFVTDICASTKGASFALDDDGRVYRWGYNQIDETIYPVHDRFGTVVNYQTKYSVYENSTPISIPRGIISGQAKVIQACNEHYFVVNKEGDLYGWGMVKMLGLGVLKDTREEQVMDIVIPTCVMTQVETVSTSFHHTIVKTKKGRILGWGKASLFSNKISGYHDKPVDVTDEYLGEHKKSIKALKAGVNYTVVLRQDNNIEFMGTETLLKAEPTAFTKNIVDITCSKYQECLAVLTEE